MESIIYMKQEVEYDINLSTSLKITKPLTPLDSFIIVNCSKNENSRNKSFQNENNNIEYFEKFYESPMEVNHHSIENLYSLDNVSEKYPEYISQLSPYEELRFDSQKTTKFLFKNENQARLCKKINQRNIDEDIVEEDKDIVKDSSYIHSHGITDKSLEKSNISHMALIQLLNSSWMLFDVVLDLFNLNEIVQEIMSQESSINIKFMLNDLLRDIEDSYTLKKPEKKYCKSIEHSSKTIQKEKRKTVTKTDLQNAESINDIVKLYSGLSLCSKKSSMAQPFGDSFKSNKSVVNTSKTKDSHGFAKLNQLLYQKYNLNPDNPYNIFSLSPFDQVIKSYRSASDRRLRALANRMNCKIIIYGPVKASQVTSLLYSSHEKILYHCIISGENKTNIQKCLKCIKDTFTSTNMREITLS